MGSPALRKLERGELTPVEYLYAKINQAVRRLGPLVTEADREVIREFLRNLALLDPVIEQHLRRVLCASRAATGPR